MKTLRVAWNVAVLSIAAGYVLARELTFKLVGRVEW